MTKTMSIRMDRDNYEFLNEISKEEPTAGKLNAKRASNPSKRAKRHQTRLAFDVPRGVSCMRRSCCN